MTAVDSDDWHYCVPASKGLRPGSMVELSSEFPTIWPVSRGYVVARTKRARSEGALVDYVWFTEPPDFSGACFRMKVLWP